MTETKTEPVKLQPGFDAKVFFRINDLVALGLSRTDSERVFQRCRVYQFGKGRAVYVKRVDAFAVIEAQKAPIA